jgi:hypothetical protein
MNNYLLGAKLFDLHILAAYRIYSYSMLTYISYFLEKIPIVWTIKTRQISMKVQVRRWNHLFHWPWGTCCRAHEMPNNFGIEEKRWHGCAVEHQGSEESTYDRLSIFPCYLPTWIANKKSEINNQTDALNSELDEIASNTCSSNEHFCKFSWQLLLNIDPKSTLERCHWHSTITHFLTRHPNTSLSRREQVMITSDLEDLLDDDVEQMVVLPTAKELKDRRKKRCPGSELDRLCIPRNHARARPHHPHARLLHRGTDISGSSLSSPLLNASISFWAPIDAA